MSETEPVARERFLMANRAFVGLDEMRRILQASVFLGDAIYVPATIRPDPRCPPADSNIIERRLRELHELGAVRFWSIEGSPAFDDYGHSWPIDAVIAHDQYIKLHSEVSDRLISDRTDFLGLSQHGATEGITDIVIGKHALWHFALRSTLGLESILLDTSSRAAIGRYFLSLLPTGALEEDVIQLVSSNLRLPDLTLLSQEQLARCREFMPAFREDLQRRIRSGDAMDPLQVRASLATGIANQIVDAYLEYINAQALRNPRNRSFGGTLWDILSLLLRRFTSGPHAERLFSWPQGTTAHPPALLLVELGRLRKPSTTPKPVKPK